MKLIQTLTALSISTTIIADSRIRDTVLSLYGETQVDFGAVENFVLSFPEPSLEVGADEEEDYQSRMTYCPIVDDGADLNGKRVEETLFFDFYLGLSDSVALTEEQTETLKAAIKEYFNAYFAFACPSSEATIENVARLGTARERGTLTLYNNDGADADKIQKMVAIGKYFPPPRIAMDELVEDSIDSEGLRRRRLVDLSFLPPDVAAILSKPFVQILNETEAFEGKVLETKVVRDVLSCNNDEDTCCDNIGFKATCSKDFNRYSFCQLECCCNFPDAPCCEQVFLEKRCNKERFCFDDSSSPTMAPTWWEINEAVFIPDGR